MSQAQRLFRMFARIDGENFGAWDDLPESCQKAWEAAAERVADAYTATLLAYDIQSLKSGEHLQ